MNPFFKIVCERVLGYGLLGVLLAFLALFYIRYDCLSIWPKVHVMPLSIFSFFCIVWAALDLFGDPQCSILRGPENPSILCRFFCVLFLAASLSALMCFDDHIPPGNAPGVLFMVPLILLVVLTGYVFWLDPNHDRIDFG